MQKIMLVTEVLDNYRSETSNRDFTVPLFRYTNQ